LVQNVLGAVASQAVVELVEALLAQDVAAGLDIINRLIADGVDPRQFAHEIVEYLRSLMLVKLGNGAHLLNVPDDTLAALQRQAAQVESAFVVRATGLFNQALIEIKSGLLDIAHLPLELAFVEAARPALMAAPVEAAAAPPLERAKPAARPVDAPAPAAAAPGGGDISVGMVQGCFGQVLAEVGKKNKIMAETLRNQARLYRVQGREIIYITSGLMKQRFEKSQPQEAINSAFSQALGQPVLVRFLAEETVSQAARAQTTDENLDALVKTAQELGGQVVE
jgi:DNA polymerase-3 subunit gamma/tau